MWENTSGSPAIAMSRRWFFFLISILTGIGLGLFYGWVINPVEYVDTSPDTLRIDYKADYVLMVAETYQAERAAVPGALDLAARRLALLGDMAPFELVYQAILFAEREGYADADLELMRALLVALEGYQPAQPPAQETSRP